MLLGALGGCDIDEVGVGEAARLAGTAVNGDTDVEDVADFAKQVCNPPVSTPSQIHLGGIAGVVPFKSRSLI